MPYRRGHLIEISGTVVDAAGAPVEGMTVVLLATNLKRELRTFRRVEEGLVRVPTTTGARGAFLLDWRWDPYYDVFRIRAEGVAPADAAAGVRQRSVLAEIDLTRRIREGSPVVVALTIGGAGSAARGAERSAEPSTVASAAPSSAPSVIPGVVPGAVPGEDPGAAQSADEKRIYEEMGKPDRVDRLELSGGEEEVAWWYFERGRSYHFRAGRLEQVVEFDPVGSP